MVIKINVSRAAGVFVAAVNLIFMILSLVLFSIALWIITSPSTISRFIHAVGNPTIKVLLHQEVLDVQLGIVLAVLAIFIFLIAFMGFYGAFKCSQFLMFMYAILVVLLLLLECSLVYYYTSNIVEKGLRVEDGQVTHAIRLAFRCCEHNISDSVEMVSPPWSCCGVNAYPHNCTTDSIFNQNCQQTISLWLSRYQYAIYVPLAVLHLLLASCSLVRRARCTSHTHS